MHLLLTKNMTKLRINRVPFQITEINDVPDLPNLKELNLGENNLSSWKNVLKLRLLPNLTNLNLYKCDLKDDLDLQEILSHEDQGLESAEASSLLRENFDHKEVSAQNDLDLKERSSPHKDDLDLKKAPCFPSLRILQLSSNFVSKWSTVAQMGLTFKVKDLRMRNNPVLDTEDGDTCRQLIIASIFSLKVIFRLFF